VPVPLADAVRDGLPPPPSLRPPNKTKVPIHTASQICRPALQMQCVETACILAELGMDEHFVASALLKDVLMESMMTEQQLRNLVAPEVADLVIKVGRLDDICQVRLCCMCGGGRWLSGGGCRLVWDMGAARYPTSRQGAETFPHFFYARSVWGCRWNRGVYH